MTSRSWTFTIFTECKDGETQPHELLEKLEKDIRVKYSIYQLERSPTTGRLHLQGYLHVRSPCRLSGVKAILGDDTAHIEKAKGSPRDNWIYCSKEESRVDGPWSVGDLPKGKGARSDLEPAYDEFKKSGYDLALLAENHPLVFIKYSRGFKDLRLQLLKYPNDEKPEVYWYYGPTGTGKSHACRTRAPDAYRLAPPVGTKNLYFYGYNGERDIIFEDYNGYGGYRFLLVFLSEGRLTVNACGYGVPVRRSRVFINSDRHPRDIFPTLFAECPNMYAQLRRRITEIIHLREPYGGILPGRPVLGQSPEPLSGTGTDPGGSENRGVGILAGFRTPEPASQNTTGTECPPAPKRPKL